jgi:predicted RNase H-like nuclease
MQVVLGIDAAWTHTQPSGVAVAMDSGTGWRLIAVAPSYRHFHVFADGEAITETRPTGSEPNAAELLASAGALCGAAPDVVAIDMPLARMPITGRRLSDNTVSRAYGARHCSTHTPSPVRPGQISAKPPGLVEVYPHPALIEFARAPMRLKYKASKGRTYWPGHTPPERRRRLLEHWKLIVAVLNARLPGVEDALPAPQDCAGGAALKAYEDMLDAVVCACVAICVLDGEAEPYGDDISAIWIPRLHGL